MDLREMVNRWTHWRSKQSAPALQVVNSDADNVWDEEPAGHVDDTACERWLLGRMLDAMKAILP